MTREEIREEIALELCLYCQKNSEDDTCNAETPCKASLLTAGIIMKNMSDAGVVIKVEELSGEETGCCVYVAFEPLI